MKPSIDQAAKQLLNELHLPVGAANTMVRQEADGACICLLVDQAYKRQLGTLPSRFKGYQVKVEPRPSITATFW
jgi:hypothetical protein